MGVPSMRSAPVTIRYGASFPWSTTSFSATTDSPTGFGRNGERVANTPMRWFPPSLGGRTVGDQFSRTACENCQISQR